MRKSAMTLAAVGATASFATAKEASEMDIKADGVLIADDFKLEALLVMPKVSLKDDSIFGQDAVALKSLQRVN